MFSSRKKKINFYLHTFYLKGYFLIPQFKHVFWVLMEMVLLSTQNICFDWEIRKLFSVMQFYLGACTSNEYQIPGYCILAKSKLRNIYIDRV